MKKQLVLTLVISLFALCVNAADFSEGAGTIEDPYQISTPDQLYHIRYDLNAHYVLVNDIDIDASNLSEGNDWGWIPIGTEMGSDIFEPFRGSLNGQGYTIYGLKMNQMNIVYAPCGLFSALEGASIKNLNIVDCLLKHNDSFLGAVAGYAINSTFKDIKVRGDINGFYAVGGIVGMAEENCYLKGCHYRHELYAKNSFGGLVGILSDSRIDSSSCITRIKGGASPVGGIVGESTNSVIFSCYSRSGMQGGDYYNRVGGIVGSNINSEIKQCYAVGYNNGLGGSGGICAEMSGVDALIEECYSVVGLKDITKFELDDNAPLVASAAQGTTVNNCYYNKERAVVQPNGYGEGLTTAELRTFSSFKGWDFVYETKNGTDDIWAYKSYYNDGFPYLTWEHPNLDSVTVFTLEPSYVRLTSAKLNAELFLIEPQKVIRHGFCYNKGRSADFDDYVVNLGRKSEQGKFSTTVVNIDKNSKFAFRAFVITVTDTIFGDLEIFVPEDIYNSIPTNTSHILISSNPVGDQFYLVGLDNEALVNLYSINGTKLFEKYIVGQETINVSNLNRGMYLLKIVTTNGTQIIKLQKE